MIRFFLSFLLFLSCSLHSASISDRLQEHIHFTKEGKNLIGYLHLSKDAPITEATYLYVKFALEDFKRRGVCFVALDLNTPGGEVFAALKISEELKKLDRQDHIPVIAFIDNWALSAGALLAYSCRFIACRDDALIGAAEPVIMSESGKMESASEKITSALRAEFASTASFFGRDPSIAQAMVDKDIILVEREGKIIRLHSMQEVASDKIISEGGKLLTLTAKEMMEYGVADFSVAYETLAAKSEKDQDLVPFASSLLSKEPFLSSIPDAYFVGYKSAKISFFTFLSHPFISSLLMIGLVAGIYLEMKTPGFGLFGSIALICLSLILLSKFAEGLIGHLEVIALCVGLILIAVEIFFFPGIIVAGALGALLVIGSLVYIFMPLHLFDKDIPTSVMISSGYSIVEWITYFILAALLASIILFFLSRYVILPSGLMGRIVLGDKQTSEGATEEKELLSSLINQEGIAHTPLRPSGKVLIHGKMYSAVAESFYIERQGRIVVIRVEADKLFVKPAL